MAVRDKDVFRRIPGHVGRLIEIIAQDTRSHTPAIEWNRATRLRSTKAFGMRDRNRLRFPAESHDYPALGIELDDHIGSLIHDPDIVMWIDLHGVRVNEAIQTLADLARESSVGVEFEEPRTAACK